MRLLLLAPLLLAGCASNTGIISTGPGSFMIAKQAATGISGLGNLKAEIVQEASEHCRKSGGNLQIVNSSESQPPYILGNYPRAEIQFRCI